MLVIVAALMCFEFVHACIAFLAEFAWEEIVRQSATFPGISKESYRRMIFELLVRILSLLEAAPGRARRRSDTMEVA